MRLDPDCIFGAKAYIVATINHERIRGSTPHMAVIDYQKAPAIAREAWTEEEWIGAWCLAIVHVHRAACGDYEKVPAP